MKENKDKEAYQVKLDLGLSKEQAEYVVDKLIMPLLFTNQHASQNKTNSLIPLNNFQENQ